MTMTFKEALIAHFNGKSVQVKTKGIQEPWEPLLNRIANFTFIDLCLDNCGIGCEFRLAPRTIIVNGVEVPAPESVAPSLEADYFVPDVEDAEFFNCDVWLQSAGDKLNLERGLVYLNKEDAIARAKAMLITG